MNSARHSEQPEGQVSAPSQEGFRGMLRTASLADLIHLECLNRRTSLLEITAMNLQGWIYIKQGDVVHAQAGSKTGNVAFLRIMKMKGGDFQVKPYREPATRTIATPWEQLLMEAAQALDEANDTTTTFTDREGDTTWVQRSRTDPIAPERIPIPRAKAPRNPRAVEALVVSSDNETLFTWQCPDNGARLALLHGLQAKCRSICERLEMGAPGMVDLGLPTGRALAHFHPTGHSFCRTEYKDSLAPEVSHA